MTDLTNNQEPEHTKVSRGTEARLNDDAHGLKRGSPEGRGDNIANKTTTNKKMEDRVKKGEQLNAGGRGAVRDRIEKNRARGKPRPKRGDVKKAIVEAGVKKVIDTGKAFCCAPGPFDVDTFIRDLPFPTSSEPTATLWAKV